MRGLFRWSGVLSIVLLLENAYLLFPVARDVVLRAEDNEALQGKRLAGRLGCFTCHGPDGRGNVPNPGSRVETVPGFVEQTPMMFVRTDEEIAEYILDGAPQRRRTDPSYREQMQQQALRMPAFRSWLRRADVDALVAYLRLISGLLQPPEDLAARGEQLVREVGCFSCHGEMGMGGQPNPGSLKGYIPGFLGDDFHELVQDDGELLMWIREGTLPRISEHPIGQWFFNRQGIRMPTYKRLLSEEQLEAIAAYVRWLAQGRWRTQPLAAPAEAASRR